jgi:hypothetical protein
MKCSIEGAEYHLLVLGTVIALMVVGCRRWIEAIAMPVYRRRRTHEKKCNAKID